MMILSADTNCSCSALLIVLSRNQYFVASLIPLVGRLVYNTTNLPKSSHGLTIIQHSGGIIPTVFGEILY